MANNVNNSNNCSSRSSSSSHSGGNPPDGSPQILRAILQEIGPLFKGIYESYSSKSRKIGFCKWFNVAKGWGFLTTEDGEPDVFVHQSVIKMEGFRSLAENERVEFEFKESDKGLEATLVTGVNGKNCSGSDRRPKNNKLFRKIRCFNCGEFGNHMASKCTEGPMPKRCHNCKSDEHLIANCPTLPPEKVSN